MPGRWPEYRNRYVEDRPFLACDGDHGVAVRGCGENAGAAGRGAGHAKGAGGGSEHRRVEGQRRWLTAPALDADRLLGSTVNADGSFGFPEHAAVSRRRGVYADLPL